MHLPEAGSEHQSQDSVQIPAQGRFRCWSKEPLFKTWLALAEAVLLVMVVPPIHAAEPTYRELAGGAQAPTAPTQEVVGGGSSHVDAAKEAPAQPPLILKARIMERPPEEYPTRILAQLKDFKPDLSVKLSRFGGWLGEKHDARGFFYTEKRDGRWWLIDPDGYRFINIGMNAVRAGTSPQMQKALPIKFGTVEKWRDATIALLEENGFNSSGAWSDNDLLRQAGERIVYTPNFRFLAAYAATQRKLHQQAGHRGYSGNFAYLFEPGFEKFADEYARQVAAYKDDPYLLGYFSDNELPFFPDLLDKFMKLNPSAPGRQVADAWLAKRKGGNVDPAAITDADRAAWVGFIGERYFSVVRKALKKYDPNHLYLGCRFHWRALECPPLFEAAGKYLDVVSVNCYAIWDPREKIEQWSRWSGRPILITEWYAKGNDSGLPNRTGAGWTVATQEARGWFYQHFALAMLQSRDCVGWHWFKYSDNDPLDTNVDPSNRDSNKGIVTASYVPYEPLLHAMRDLNREVYPLTVYFDNKTDLAKSKATIQESYQP